MSLVSRGCRVAVRRARAGVRLVSLGENDSVPKQAQLMSTPRAVSQESVLDVAHQIPGVFASTLLDMVPFWISKVEIEHGELHVHCEHKHLVQLTKFLRDNTLTQYKMMVDMTAIDRPEREKRFELVYILRSIVHNSVLYVHTNCGEAEPVDSLTPLHNSADWAERECYDMFGVFFRNHPDLRRVLTDYGFDGHPQRKDFPLTGYEEVRYDDSKGRVVYEPLEVAQEFRNYEHTTPWYKSKAENERTFEKAALETE